MDPSEYERMIKTEVDEDYIKILERKLEKLRKDETQLNSRDILNDLKNYREDKLFHLMTKSDHCFEDNFTDQPVVISYLRRRLAPETVAVHYGELTALLEADQLALEVNKEVTSAVISTQENSHNDINHKLIRKCNIEEELEAVKMKWKERHFIPVPCCNTYSLHQLSDYSVICVSLSGKVHWTNDTEPTDLVVLFNQNLDNNENLEIVASDCAKHNHNDCIAILVTCWVLFDQMWMPKRYFAAMFKATADRKFVLSYKLELDNVPSYTRITAEAAIANNRHCWLIFTASRAARLFVIQPISLAIEEIESVGDIYPGLDLGDLPGFAIRSNCLQTSTYRWSVLGFDTGYVIATALSMKTNFIEHRSKLKFSGVVSVLLILQHVGREDKVSILISSTLGPAAVWMLSLSPDKSNFEWKRITVLEDTRDHDAVVCSASGHLLIAIGTYGGVILVYKRLDLLSGDQCAFPCSVIEMHASVMSMIFLEDDVLTVLTTSGLHTVEAIAQND
ncbi:Coiled-coil domain-containing protein [Dirofilaria immitis]